MASACVNNIGVSQPTTSYSSYGWLSPRISLSREEDSSKSRPKSPATAPSSSPSADPGSDPPEIQDATALGGGGGDFEFRLEDPVTMLPADELFSDGKLVPLHFSTMKQNPPVNASSSEIRSSSLETSAAKSMEISGTDPHLFSPKAPRCSSRWRELLGLKKFSQNANQVSKSETQTTKISLLSNNNPKSLKYFLHRSSKSSSSSSSSSIDSSLSLPLLKDSDCESLSISSSRLSLSSSSSGHEHEDLPRLSLDSDKPSTIMIINPSPNPFAPCRNINPNPPRMRVKPRPGSGSDTNQTTANGTRMGRSPIRRDSSCGVTSRGVSVDSPRMNSSGKIVFQSLERSSSSPSSFNGGPRFKHRGMERSYSANVRITPVLNVPVCSLRGSSKSGSVFGFGQLFSSSPQKAANGGSTTSKGHHSHSNNTSSSSTRSRTDKNH
ncbi:hypothetical protein PTKIN_Ptkin14bG0224000 [Pterospermum kingtungense]